MKSLQLNCSRFDKVVQVLISYLVTIICVSFYEKVGKQ